MGLNTWKYSPEGRILKSDIMIAKNYLLEKEIKKLEKTVSGFFDYPQKSAIPHPSGCGCSTIAMSTFLGS